MRLLERLKAAFNPRSHDATLSHYIPAPDYSYEPVELSIWRSDLDKRLQDWKGDTGRIPNAQVLTTQGPLLFALKGVTTQGLGGTSIPFGDIGTFPVSGFAGRPAAITPTSLAAEFPAVQQ